MPDLQAIVQFSNVEQVESFTMTLAHGVTPSQGILRIAPQARNIETLSDVRMRFGAERMVFRDCLANEASYTYNSSGFVVGLTILDRRWKWRFPTISGTYNVRGADGQIFKNEEKGQAPDKNFAVSDSERTPKELIELCLKALGENGYILEGIPQNLRPAVNWDLTNAALALQEVCDAVGCRVVLQLNNRIAIRPVGVGRQVPNGPVEEFQSSVDPPDRPSKLRVHCGPSWFQADLELEAVGKQTDGTVKLIDDLDYKPADGWNTVDPLLMEAISTDQKRSLALQTVYRWYRIKTPIKIKGYDEEIKWLNQIEVLGVQVYIYKEFKTLRHRSAVVWGQWYDEDSGDSVSETLQDIVSYAISRSIVPFGKTIEDGIVKFTSAPVYKLDSDNNPIPAVLKLRTAVRIRDAKTGSYVRHSKDRVLDPRSSTEPRSLVIPELELYYVKGKPDNQDTIDKELEKYLDAFEQEYKIKAPQTVRYAGWLPIDPDGAIQSVTWTMDIGGATTQVQRDDDRGSPTTRSYALRRLTEKYNAALTAKAKRDPERQIPVKVITPDNGGES